MQLAGCPSSERQPQTLAIAQLSLTALRVWISLLSSWAYRLVLPDLASVCNFKMTTHGAQQVHLPPNLTT